MRADGKPKRVTVIGEMPSSCLDSMPARLRASPYAADGVRKAAVGRYQPAVNMRYAANGA
jgi:hypothetical protein